MIEFRQKNFIAPIIGLLASTGAGIGVSAVQTGKHHKQDQEQAEQFQRQQMKEQKKQNEALDKIAKAAEKDPIKAQMAAQTIQQRSYAVSASAVKGALQRGGQTVYELASGIGNKRAAKVVGSGLALGGGMALGSYVIDKAIQADRKNITGNSPLPVPQKYPEEKSKERNKKAAKIATTAAITAGTFIAARKGALGQGFQNLSKGLNNAGEKINFKGFGQSVKHHFKEGVGIKKVVPTKEAMEAAKKAGKTLKPSTKFTAGPLLGGIGFAGLFAAPYIGERKQLKKQVQAQQKEYAESEQPKKGSALKKLAIGTVATVGSLAAMRRVGPAGIRKGINDMYMTYGNKLAGKSPTTKIGNWMMKSGSEEYGKAVVKARNSALQKQIRAGEQAKNGGSILNRITKRKDQTALDKIVNAGEKAKNTVASLNLDVNKIGKARLEKIQSGKVSRKLGQDILEKAGGAIGVGPRATTNYLNRLTNTNPKNGAVYSQQTQNVANFLKRHKRVLATGAVGVGLVGWKPFTWGDTAVRGAVGAVDKNAFAYEKSKGQEI